MREAQADKGDDVKPAAGLSNKSYSYDFTPVSYTHLTLPTNSLV